MVWWDCLQPWMIARGVEEYQHLDLPGRRSLATWEDLQINGHRVLGAGWINQAPPSSWEF